jgi:glycosyltransferase involved in cell wall biosynthesis
MISVIIPHANSPQLLFKLLYSLREQTMVNFLEVIVVVNPESKYPNGYPEWKFNFPLTWDKSAAGANRARSRGVQLSRGKVLLFLDDDCEILDKQFVQKHLAYHEDENLSGVGGRYRLHGPQNHWGRVYNKLQNDWLRSHRLPGGFNVHLLGGNSSFKKEVFAEESFDENIIFGGTETEFQIRLHQRKKRLKLFEDIEVGHEGQLRFPEFITKSFKQGIGAAYIVKKHRRPSKFIFADNPLVEVDRLTTITEWLYRASFEAGRKYFRDTDNVKATKSEIYNKVIRMTFRRIFAKDFFLWAEPRILSQVIAQRLLSSQNKSDNRENN